MFEIARTFKRSLPPAMQRFIERCVGHVVTLADFNFPQRWMRRQTPKWDYLEWLASHEGPAPKPFLRTFRPSLFVAIALRMRNRSARRTLSLPPSQRVKARTIRSHARFFSIRTFIETGTWHGDTISSVAGFFDCCITIELSDHHWRAASSRFRSYPNVECVHGDSGIELKRIVQAINRPALFWLDAHSSGDGTVNSGVGPIFDELRTIFSSTHPHVILIDDARGHQVDEIRAAVPNGYDFAVRNDIIRITPIQTTAEAHAGAAVGSPAISRDSQCFTS